MSEFITIPIGQCGNQIGYCFWKNAVQEYGIELSHVSNHRNTKCFSKKTDMFESFSSFFWCPTDISESLLSNIGDMEKAKIKARAVCIDMEDSVVSRFRRGPLRCLFNESCLLTNYPGSGNNWAEGYFAHGTKYSEEISDKVRKAVECCDGLHGFLLLYSLGGGTGSGLGSRVLSLLEDQYPNIDRFYKVKLNYFRLVTSVFPAGNEDVITAPYNVSLATHELIKKASCVFPVNNQALMEICGRTKLNNPRDKNSKYFQDINNIIVNMLLHLTSGARFRGSLNVDMNEISTNMVPYPGMHFLVSGVSPLSTICMKAPPPGTMTRVDNVMSGTWARTNQLIKVDPLNGIMLAAAMIVRGDASLTDLRRNVEKLQKKGKFVSWNQHALKVGMCSVPPPGHKLSALGLYNTSSICRLFQEVALQFNMLFKRRAHVHHYAKIDGFETSQFSESLEQIKNITDAYLGLETHQPVYPPRFKVV